MKNLYLFFIVCAALLFSACTSERTRTLYEIKIKEKELFGDSSMVPDPQKAGEMIGLYKDFADRFPEDPLVPDLLFKAADIASGIRRDMEAISFYKIVETKYSDSPKAPVSLFMQAFVYENNLHDNVQAEAKYAEFLRRYPGHKLAPSAKASLEQIKLGLTTEDLIKMFQAKQDSLANSK